MSDDEDWLAKLRADPADETRAAPILELELTNGEDIYGNWTVHFMPGSAASRWSNVDVDRWSPRSFARRQY